MKNKKKLIFNTFDDLYKKKYISLHSKNKDVAETVYNHTGFDIRMDTISRYFTEWRELKKERNAGKKHNVLVIGDLHAPFQREDALRHIKKMMKLKPDFVVFLGDLFDNHYHSFHETDPDGLSANQEYKKAYKFIQELHDLIPNALVCTGNHDALINRKAFKAGITKKWIKTLPEMFNLDGWDFKDYHRIGDFIFTHGLGQQALSRSENLGLSVVQGHYHNKFDVTAIYDANVHGNVRYAVNGGCLIDSKAYAFAYGKFGAVNKMGLTIIEDIYNKPVIKQFEL